MRPSAARLPALLAEGVGLGRPAVMRTAPILLALVLSLSVAAAAAAPKKKAQDQSPPTAQPDTTLVTPDPTPPPTTNPAPTSTVQMQPIGPAGGSTSSALLAVANGGNAPAPLAAVAAPAPAPAPAPTPAPAPPPPAQPAPPAPVSMSPPSPVPLAEAPVVARAEQCLRSQATRAARAETSVKLAVDLLLEDLCGAEVERASLYAHNLDAVATFTPQSERTAAGLAGARVDPETGEILNPAAGDVGAALAAAGFARDVDPPPQIRRFASELVLAIRGAPLTPTPARPAAEPHKKSH